MNIYDTILNILYPRTACFACEEELPLDEDGLCAGCRAKLISAPLLPAPAELAACRAAFVHEGAARELVHALKYGNRRFVAGSLALFMAGLMDQSWQIGAIVPVPLHKKRLRERGFNQSLLIAKSIASRGGIPVKPLLTRIRDTKTQTDLSAAQRATNVEGAFTSAPCSGNILLIDDVFTTGSTLSCCAKALRMAGAKEVYALTATVAGVELK